MKTYFMRHAQTNYNVLGLCDDNPSRKVHLTETGRQQAMRTANLLKEEPIEKIIVSQLPRTRETAEIINRYHGVEILAHPGINDLRTGCDGRPVEAYFDAISDDPLHAKVGSGENRIEHKKRVLSFLEWLSKLDHQLVLIVAHEETLRVIAAQCRELQDEAMLDLNFANCEILPCSLHGSKPIPHPGTLE